MEETRTVETETGSPARVKPSRMSKKAWGKTQKTQVNRGKQHRGQTIRRVTVCEIVAERGHGEKQSSGTRNHELRTWGN